MAKFLKIAAAAAFLPPTIVWAQVGPDQMLGPPADVQQMLGSQDDPAPPVGACPKLCANDMSPCDPEYMKQADGRCGGVDTFGN